MSKKHKSQGFTLIELMLVAVMLGMIGLTIVSTFAGGLKIFHRMESATAVKADVLLSFEKMERDLRSTFALNGIDFIGEAKKVTFPAILRTASEAGGGEESLGAVSYYRDDSSDERVLSREERPYALAANKESNGQGDITVLAPIEDISFEYFTYDPEEETYHWADTWDKSELKDEEKAKGTATKSLSTLEDRAEEIPLGVRIKISYTEGGKDRLLSQMVFIKTAVSLNAAKRRAVAEKVDSKGTPSEQ